jgi:hypothetical protein
MAGASAQFSVHLHGGLTNRNVSVMLDPFGGESQLLVDEEPVDATGKLDAAPVVWTNTVVSASYNGESDWTDTQSEPVMIGVHALVAEVVLDSYGRSGRYWLFHEGTDPRINVALEPDVHNGEEIVVMLQQSHGASWRTLDRRVVELDPDSQTGIVVKRAAPGSDYRLRAVFHGNQRNLGTRGSWRYLRIRSSRLEHDAQQHGPFLALPAGS